MTTLDAQRLAREGYSRPSANGVTVDFFPLRFHYIPYSARCPSRWRRLCRSALLYSKPIKEKSGPAGQRQAVQGTQDVTVGQ